MPVEPPPTPWRLPRADRSLAGEVVGIGADLEPGTLLAAYRAGLFPMRLDGLEGPLAWWSPDPRGVLPLDGLLVSRSLRRSLRRYTVTVDAAFDEVVAGCADPGRTGGWIDGDVAAAYSRLHALGWAHSLEVWTEGQELVGGLYGVATGGLFAGESMFSRATDASKVALVHLVELLRADGAPRLLDVQWRTEHLATLGVVAVPRRRYLRLLAQALGQPLPPAFDDGRG
ncbi:leucyl/phenylalanyl-tRNA--protein transferase [Motilibacter peucedani]|uniref:Leucyl/phenylalanyl-tRNA--protein transferase n=1 Tax=Motilibacter peucedani TaxID=598650 RepID=A0A420XPC8_9ACTN|nr:leucyl/phenylalanyl-tRNA--protein transferase [Motilibacter peucedani]RKS74035.1 leucyl/phenylalanyl-tRNA--protein transferase [Motilibacter peucedani]